ncbi:S41 family peptidase [Membranihabitans marinus]|uniref:S41 family peptidase n=1 Tax=Membranihabitans marinus TaxID=1227546 RepID=UPI001F2C5C0A|nr:S41 family peptidase [Membranihabitans marinus]
MKNQYFLFLGLLLILSNTSSAQERIYRFPDVSKDRIVFSYADDLYIVSKNGGQAKKLSSPPGAETSPRFSPDGQTIAFSGNYDGSVDVFTLSVNGGIPKRITHHGMRETVIDWSPKGDHILFSSSMESGKQRFNQFYTVPVDGGLPQKLPLEQAEFGSYSPNQSHLAFTYKSRVYRTWKRYKGGMAADIFIFNLNSYESENITQSDDNDEMPMWHGSLIYYLSDKDDRGRYNIWRYDTQTKKHKQITHFKDFDVQFPSIGPADLVFELGGQLYLLDLKTEKYSPVNIDIIDDYEKTKPRNISLSNRISNIQLSPNGQRVLVESRGEVLDLPAEKGATYNLSQSSGSAERYPAWSPNGKKIAYWSDENGEYQLHLYDYQSRKQEVISNFKDGYRYKIWWSPDSKKIGFIDQTMTIYIMDIHSKELTKVDQGKWMYQGDLNNFTMSWSSDSRWITYDRGLDNRMNALFLFDVEKKEVHQITAGFYNYNNPVFSPDGKYLCFRTDQNFTPQYSSFDNSWVYTLSNQIGLIPLNKSLPSPLLAQNDTVAFTEASLEKTDTVEEKSASSKSSDTLQKDSLVIDIDGMESRAVILPLTAGSFRSISAIEGKIIYLRNPIPHANGEKTKLQYYDLNERKEETIIEDVSFYVLSHDQKKILTGKPNKMGIISPNSGQKIDKTVPVGDLQMNLDPKKEWEQIFNEVWRIERDFFYDKNMHGTNWAQLKSHYGQLIQSAQTRSDVNYILGELIGELNASHTYRGGGDDESSRSGNVGYLGVDFEYKNGSYQIKKIIRAAPWDNEVKSPLSEPGIDVSEGDYILAVNGIMLTQYSDPWAAFSGLANKTVELLVGKTPSVEEGKKVFVKTLDSETRLRNLSWIEKNRHYVDSVSNGEIGYIYVPSTGLDGQKELVRMFYGQIHKSGLIIDERFNNGGQIPDRFVELLNRPPLAYWDVRDGETWSWPPVSHFGPKAMLINGWSGSGGDAFPDYFRKAGLGPLIGTKTWGGLIGITGAPSLIDGGGITAPTFRMYNPDGSWFPEGKGVVPDIEVLEDPTALAKGKDIQLDEAIKYIQNELKTAPKRIPAVPKVEKRN